MLFYSSIAAALIIWYAGPALLDLLFGEAYGGSGAAYRLHEALLHREVDSWMRVCTRQGNGRRVIVAAKGWRRLWWLLHRKCSRALEHLQNDPGCDIHSLNLFRSELSETIARIQPDLIHLHWIAGETLSIKQIGQLPKPLVWTLHDMWPFCGAEHLESPGPLRSQEGYFRANRPTDSFGLDLNRLT